MVKPVDDIVGAGIAVLGHIGLTPRTTSSLGGYRVQGKSTAVAADLYHDPLALQEALCSMMILEFVPTMIAANNHFACERANDWYRRRVG